MTRLILLTVAATALTVAGCQRAEDVPASETTSAADSATDASAESVDVEGGGAATAEAATGGGTAPALEPRGERLPAGTTRPTAPPAAAAAADAPARPADATPPATPLIPLPAPRDPDRPEAPQSLPRPDTVMPDTTPDGRPAY